MKKILFLSNHFLTLYAFRKELIKILVEDGYEVYLSLPENSDNKYFEDLGCKIILTEIDRRGMNPLNDLKLLLFYKKMIPKVNPDIIFSYTIKPNIYGALACNRKYKQVCNITGTGATFLKKNTVNMICTFLYKISVKKCYKVFFQNIGDRDYFIKHSMITGNYDILPGSGCNLDEHPYVPMTGETTVRFIFIGRLMKLKGIDEYLGCAKLIKSKYSNIEFLIAGWNEEKRYKNLVADYQKCGYVNYIGFRKDINNWIAYCNCIVLPSHGGEGIPNVLLESASIGRACIASKVNGSINVIDDGKTGYLFNTGDTADLVKQVEKFIHLTAEEKTQMGKAARRKIESEYDRRIVIKKYIDELKELSKE